MVNNEAIDNLVFQLVFTKLFLVAVFLQKNQKSLISVVLIDKILNFDNHSSLHVAICQLKILGHSTD